MNGEEVRQGGKKIIPREELEVLLETEALLEQAKAEIVERKQELEEEGKKEKERGFQEGFQEGLMKFNEHVLLFQDKIKEMQYLMQQQVLPLVLKATKKIVGEQIRLEPETIIDVVMQSVKSVLHCKFIKLYLHKQDMDIVEQKKDTIKQLFDQVESFQIEERADVAPGGCVIETERGILNATLESQFRALENAFEAHMKR
jgi:type III secretion protein L